VVLLLAGDLAAADRGQFGGCAAAVARLDGGVRGGSVDAVDCRLQLATL
jgi:hypothetical protein